MRQEDRNPLDVLDELRELPPGERERRLRSLPAEQQGQLRRWLSAAEGPRDALETSALDARATSVVKKLLGEELRTGKETMGQGGKERKRETPPPRLDFQAGDVLANQFRIVCQLGRGGMGEVFRAIDEHTGESVALKFLPAGAMADPQALSMLKSEVRLAHRVRSPYVCAIHALHLSPSPLPPFIAMQFVEGEDLGSLLNRVERLSGPKVLRIAHELAEGLAAIHAAGILHRDLKPSNIMLDTQGMTQILDFGIAALVHPGERDATLLAGTPDYLAPEVATDGATPASDIYALGLILFELATGQKASRVIREGTQPRAMLENYKAELPAGLIQAILRCLQGDPAARFQEMQELQHALPPMPDPRTRRTENIATIAISDAVPPLRPAAVAALLAFIAVAAVIALLAPAPPGSATGMRMTKEPMELASIARRVAGVLGAEHDGHRATGFSVSAVSAGPSDLCFWYRSATQALEPLSALRGLSVSDPPPGAGITTVLLNRDGVLREAFRQPDRVPPQAAGDADSFPSAAAEGLARLKHSIGAIQRPPDAVGNLLPVGWSPPVPLPPATRYWWLAAGETPSSLNRRFIVATLGDEVVYLGRWGGWTPSDGGGRPKALPARVLPAEAAFWWTLALPVLGLALAVRNARLRRCDMRHALHVACVVFVLSFLGWVLMTRPGITGKFVLERWTIGVGAAMFIAAEAWISYAAVDPYARRTWKRCLIGYARLMTGWPRAIVRDAVVGRNLLVGVAFGLVLVLLLKALEQWTSNAGTSEVVLRRQQMTAAMLGDGWRTIGLLCRVASSAIVFALLQLVTLVLLQWLTRLRWLAVALFCVITPVLWALFRGDLTLSACLIYPAMGVLTAFVLVAEGVLATAVGLFVMSVLTTVPITLDPSAWNLDVSLVVLLFLALFAIAGAVASLRHAAAVRWLPSDPIRIGRSDS